MGTSSAESSDDRSGRTILQILVFGLTKLTHFMFENSSIFLLTLAIIRNYVFVEAGGTQ